MEYEWQNKPSKHGPITIKHENKEPQTQIRCHKESTTSATNYIRRRRTTTTRWRTTKNSKFWEKTNTNIKKHHHRLYYYAESSEPFKSICGTDNDKDDDDKTTINLKWCKYYEVLPNNVLPYVAYLAPWGHCFKFFSLVIFGVEKRHQGR